MVLTTEQKSKELASEILVLKRTNLTKQERLQNDIVRVLFLQSCSTLRCRKEKSKKQNKKR